MKLFTNPRASLYRKLGAMMAIMIAVLLLDASEDESAIDTNIVFKGLLLSLSPIMGAIFGQSLSVLTDILEAEKRHYHNAGYPRLHA